MCEGSVLLQAGVGVGGGRGEGVDTHTHPQPPPTHTQRHTHTGKDINAFAFSPLHLSSPLIFRIVKYAKVTEVNR